LTCPPGSPEADLVWEAAHELAIRHSQKGRVWAAIGVDYRPCPRNCRFCSFGSDWGIVRDSDEWAIEQVTDAARQFTEQGAYWITVRTTQHYPLKRVCELAQSIRAHVGDAISLVVNTGEFSFEEAEQMHAAGYRVAYHVYRLREGTDTGINPAARLQTLENIRRSALQLAYLVEPVGVEHTAREIATEMVRARDFGATLTGAMARVPVPGTPLGELPPLPEEKLTHVVAVSRLVAGDTATDICVHPPTETAVAAGANVVVVETGAVPRDRQEMRQEWRGLTMDQALAMLARHYPGVEMPARKPEDKGD